MVLDFRPKEQPKAWYSRIGMRAFMYIFVSAAVVVSLVMRELRKSQPFGWLVEGGLYQNAPAETVDTRLVAPPKPRPSTNDGDDVVRIAPADDEPEPAIDDKEIGYFPGVKPGLLSDIQDGSPHRPAEREAYYHFMKILKEHEATTFGQYLKESGRDGVVAFAQLFRQPSHYRGHLVRVKARAHSCIENKFGKNPWGLEKYYHLYLESPEGHLMQVNVLEVPDRFPRSKVDTDRQYTKFDESVEFVGFFYKLIPYSTREDLRNSPLLFARTVEWTPPQVAPAPSVTWTTLAGVLIGGMIVGLAMAFFITRQTAVKSFKRKHGPPTQAEIAALGKLGEAHRAGDVADTGDPPASDHAGNTHAGTNGAPSANGHPAADAKDTATGHARGDSTQPT